MLAYAPTVQFYAKKFEKFDFGVEKVRMAWLMLLFYFAFCLMEAGFTSHHNDTR